jgi:dihydropteroate synthase
VDPTWHTPGRTTTIDRPAVMGIVNASPESFSGDGGTTLDQQVAQVRAQLDAGALLVDLGGQSANTRTPELSVEEEAARLVPLVEAVRAAGIDGLLSVDTYKPAVADACLRAGADVINDVSALHHPELAEVVADHGAGYVLMHTVGPPKVKILETDLYGDVVDDVVRFAHEAMARLAAAGVSAEQVLFDPGVDFAKTPRQSLDLLHGVDRLTELGRPLLLALSRKDFIGAVTHTTPRQRDAGTLAAVGAVAAAVPRSVFRVHDVAATVQYLAVQQAIADPSQLPEEAVLADELRREPLGQRPSQPTGER